MSNFDLFSSAEKWNPNSHFRALTSMNIIFSTIFDQIFSFFFHKIFSMWSIIELTWKQVGLVKAKRTISSIHGFRIIDIQFLTKTFHQVLKFLISAVFQNNFNQSTIFFFKKMPNLTAFSWFGSLFSQFIFGEDLKIRIRSNNLSWVDRKPPNLGTSVTALGRAWKFIHDHVFFMDAVNENRNSWSKHTSAMNPGIVHQNSNLAL